MLSQWVVFLEYNFQRHQEKSLANFSVQKKNIVIQANVLEGKMGILGI